MFASENNFWRRTAYEARLRKGESLIGLTQPDNHSSYVTNNTATLTLTLIHSSISLLLLPPMVTVFSLGPSPPLSLSANLHGGPLSPRVPAAALHSLPQASTETQERAATRAPQTRGAVEARSRVAARRPWIREHVEQRGVGVVDPTSSPPYLLFPALSGEGGCMENGSSPLFVILVIY